MSGLDGCEKPALPESCSVTTTEHAPGDPDPPHCQSLREETEVRAKNGKSGLETVAFPPAQLPAEGDAPRDPAVCGGHGFLETTAGKEDAPLPTEVLETASCLAGTESTLKNACQGGEPGGPGGEKALENCDGGRSGSQVIVGAKAAEANPEKCAILAVDEERPEGVEEKMEMEVAEKPVGEERDVVEESGEMGKANEAARPGSPDMDRPMNPLEAIQQELDTVNAQADRAFLHLEQKFGRMRRHYLERRNYIIQNIPGFWATAFRNHPQLSAMIRGQDAEMVRYITNLEVKELRHPRTGCKFKFFFRRNPYFRNKLIVKEYEVRSTGQVVSLSTPIIWRRGHEPQSFIRRNQDIICSFFTWFSDHSLPESDRIAEIIKEDLWPNPLQYYLMREGARRPRRRLLREPVEIPRPFGFQSG